MSSTTPTGRASGHLTPPSSTRPFGRSALALASAAAATAVLAALSPSAAQADATAPDERQLINRMDGSRLALMNDGTGEGAVAITLRSPGWQYKTAKWINTYDADGNMTIKNVAAGKCLQPATASPKAGDGLVVKTCDGSAAQKWTYRWEESGNGNSTWFALRPKSAPGLAITLAVYQGSGSWDTLYLDRDQNSTDRLWRFLRDGQTW
ncbi:RICIN domain-containing protein [Sphaerisporangium sp. NPDC051017]|uniref:RICIN domain-containing protein n=1 Tax=Sphaerisporangium sp. NPDC051017 TaxID=3154636 RepID=UPI00341680F7